MKSDGVKPEPRFWVGVIQSGQSRWPGVFGGMAIGVVTAVASSLLLLALAPAFQDAFTPASCDEPRGLKMISADSATALSSLTEPISGLEHPASLAIDGDLGTSWVEGVDGLGEGQTLSISLSGEPDLQLVCVINGYAKSQELYLRNAKVRQVEVATDQGVKTVMLRQKPIEDYTSYQSLDLPKGKTKSIVLTIRIAVGGVGGDRAADTSISEVELWARQ